MTINLHIVEKREIINVTFSNLLKNRVLQKTKIILPIRLLKVVSIYDVNSKWRLRIENYVNSTAESSSIESL